MSGIHLALLGMNFGAVLPDIGAAYEGGFFAGQIGVSGTATHNLVVAPLSSGQTVAAWKNANTATPGADSDIDGPQNTADMVADGNSTVYPLAHFCNDAVIGGFSDWYMPAKNELEVCYFNLKPTTQSNNTSSGINPNAVPARASNYTTSPSVPSQTSAAAFQTGGSEPFSITGSPAVGGYWSSSEASPSGAFVQLFTTGSQYNYASGYGKGTTCYVRAVRRVAV